MRIPCLLSLLLLLLFQRSNRAAYWCISIFSFLLRVWWWDDDMLMRWATHTCFFLSRWDILFVFFFSCWVFKKMHWRNCRMIFSYVCIFLFFFKVKKLLLRWGDCCAITIIASMHIFKWHKFLSSRIRK